MANVLVLKNSAVSGNVPLAASLIEAEPALNTADKKLFSKDAAGNVFEVGVPMSHIGAGAAVHAAVTTTVNGFMSSADKTKLDGVATGANLYALPIATASALGGVKAGTGVTIDGAGVISVPVVVSSSVTTALGFTPANLATTYTKTESDAAIQAVVGAAPAALNTLVEIAAQLATDESAASALTTAVSLKAPIASPTFTGTVGGITKAMVGLPNVDNTTDLLKPISTATQTALDLKATTSTLGSMSTQSAAAVVITGGTINGVTFNGGTF